MMREKFKIKFNFGLEIIRKKGNLHIMINIFLGGCLLNRIIMISNSKEMIIKKLVNMIDI